MQRRDFCHVFFGSIHISISFFMILPAELGMCMIFKKNFFKLIVLIEADWIPLLSADSESA